MDVTHSPTITAKVSVKSAQAVGQLAKVAVAEARSAGAELPKNAQGIAASSIAKGADPASVFAAMITPEEGPNPSTPVASNDAENSETPIKEVAVNDGGAETDERPAIEVDTLTDMETALALLEDAWMDADIPTAQTHPSVKSA